MVDEVWCVKAGRPGRPALQRKSGPSATADGASRERRNAPASEGGRYKSERKARGRGDPSPTKAGTGDVERDAFGEAALVPIGVGGNEIAGGVELGDLLGREFPAGGGEILAELAFVAGAENNAGDGGAAQEPVERDSGNAFAGFLGDGVDGIHDLVDVLIGDGRTSVGGFVETALLGERMAAADFSG